MVSQDACPLLDCSVVYPGPQPSSEIEFRVPVESDQGSGLLRGARQGEDCAGAEMEGPWHEMGT